MLVEPANTGDAEARGSLSSVSPTHRLLAATYEALSIRESTTSNTVITVLMRRRSSISMSPWGRCARIDEVAVGESAEERNRYWNWQPLSDEQTLERTSRWRKHLRVRVPS